MAAVLITDAEWDLLAGEPAELLKLYMTLRRRMDFATGIAGVRTIINEIVLRDAFVVDPIPGRPKQKPVSREKYRSAIRRLEKIGLLVTIGPLVFEFPHARKDNSAQNSYNRATTELQPQQQPDQDTPKPSTGAAYSDSDNEAATGLFFEQVPNNNLLPVPDLPSTLHCARDDSDFTPQRFAMHDNWQPTPKGWSATATRNGISPDSLNPDSLGEFRSYWINRPDKHQSQGQWEHSLAQTIKRTHARSNGHDRPTEGSPARQQRDSHRPRSAVDRVKQAIAEREAREAAAAAAGQALGEDGRDVRSPLDGQCWRVG